MTTRLNQKVEVGVAAPCGLYCGDCPAEANGAGPHVCCTRKYCPSRLDAKICEIYQCCVAKQGLSDCSNCLEFPCSMLLHFSHNPRHPERIPAIINLQKRKLVGIGRWLAEERLFWRETDRQPQWVVYQRTLQSERHYRAEIRSRVIALEAEIALATDRIEREPVSQCIQTGV